MVEQEKEWYKSLLEEIEARQKKVSILERGWGFAAGLAKKEADIEEILEALAQAQEEAEAIEIPEA